MSDGVEDFDTLQINLGYIGSPAGFLLLLVQQQLEVQLSNILWPRSTCALHVNDACSDRKGSTSQCQLHTLFNRTGRRAGPGYERGTSTVRTPGPEAITAFSGSIAKPSFPSIHYTALGPVLHTAGNIASFSRNRPTRGQLEHQIIRPSDHFSNLPTAYSFFFPPDCGRGPLREQQQRQGA